METTMIGIAINAKQIRGIYRSVRPVLRHFGAQKINCKVSNITRGKGYVCPGLIVAETVGVGEYQGNRYALVFGQDGISVLFRSEEREKLWTYWGDLSGLHLDDMQPFKVKDIQDFFEKIITGRIDKFKIRIEKLQQLGQVIKTLA